MLPFALLSIENSTDKDTLLDSTITSTCLHAGAVDIICSPLHPEDINRVIGHIKEMIRPPANLLAAHMAQNLVNSIKDASAPGVACHRPDLILSAERKAKVENAIASWHFPAQDFNMDELTYAAVHMVEQLVKRPELESYGLERARLVSFILATRRQYKHENEVHYHNWRHAVDVTQSVYCFLQGVHLCPIPESDSRRQREINAVERLLTPLDGLILLVSAIGHDVGHPGVNNAFLVACNHPLAQTYNDKSVLENYHCAAYSQLLRRHWPALNKIDGFRATMISTILATDMQRHFEYMKSLGDFKAKTEATDASVDDWSDKDREQARELIMALLIKAADISNVARPFDISSRWAKILMNEFARQGELESELEIPTCLFGGPPDKEDILAAAQSQKGFMSLFGFPLFQGISEIIPSFSCAVRELENNREIWDKKIAEEKEKRKPNDTSHLTLSSVTPEEVERATTPRKSEPRIVPLQAGQTPSTPTKRGAANSGEPSPSRHAAHELRQQLAQGIAADGDKRSSAPLLGSAGSPLSPLGTSSRRSSKDVALDQLQQLTAFAHQSLSPTPSSRRGSSDAGIHVHQSYPSSRRGSKDESLTTILVTSGSTPNRRSSPSSPGNATSPSKSSNKRQSIPQSQKQAPTRTSVPSSKSHTTSTATATTTYSPSTQPSSVAMDDESQPPTQPLTHHASVPSTEDPFKSPGNWPNNLDGDHRVAGPEGVPRELPSTPPTPPPLSNVKSDSPQLLSQISSNGTDDSRATPRKGEGVLRESRSRSRLRKLKFWRRNKDVTSADAVSADSPGGSP